MLCEVQCLTEKFLGSFNSQVFEKEGICSGFAAILSMIQVLLQKKLHCSGCLLLFFCHVCFKTWTSL